MAVYGSLGTQLPSSGLPAGSHEATGPGDHQEKILAPVLLVALSVLATLLIISRPAGGAWALLVLAALLTVPGYASIPRAVRLDRWAKAALTVSSSMVIGTLLALFMVWLGWWHPLVTGSALLLVAGGYLAARELPTWRQVVGNRRFDRRPDTPALHWKLALDDGRTLEPVGTVILGRTPPTVEGDDTISVQVGDTTRTVSRTHLVVQLTGDHLQVVDQGSSNGTTVTGSDAVVRQCQPGEPMQVEAGDIVSFGQHWLQVAHGEKTDDDIDTMAAPPPAGGRPTRLSAIDRQSLLVGAVFAVALVAWITALAFTSSTDLGAWGLLAEYRWPWFVALILTVTMIIWGLVSSPGLSDGWMAAFTAALVLVLYSSATFVEATPRLPWIYKHISVTRYIEVHGSVDPDIDLYQRWPGFFAWTAQIAELTNQLNPVHWAGLAEPFFALLDALLVLALARAISRDRGYFWTATLLFVLGNWVNQNYFAPQALGYALYLSIALVLLLTATAEPRRLGVFLEHVSRRLGRPSEAGSENGFDLFSGGRAPSAVSARRWSGTFILVAFAVVVASHQLTPYLTLLVLAPLFVLGYFRPLWLVIAMATLAVGYLVPNYDYIQSHFGVFSGFDPVANAVYSSIDRNKLPATQVWSGRGAYLISGLLVLLGLLGLFRRLRAGGTRSAVVIGWMTLAPALILVVQSYGGEGRLRVYLFALPWCAMAAAWAFWPGTHRPVRWVRSVLAAALVLIATLFTLSYSVSEAEVQVPASEVAAAEWLDQQAEQGDVVLATSPMFPLLIGPNYDRLVPEAELTRYVVYYPELMTRQDVVGIAEELNGGRTPDRLLAVFSDEQYAYVDRRGLYRPGELAQLESEIAAAPGVQLRYQRDGVRVYEMS